MQTKWKVSRKRLAVLFMATVFVWNGFAAMANAETISPPIAADNYTLNFSHFRSDAKFDSFVSRFKAAADAYAPSFSVADLGITSAVSKAMYLEFCYMNPEYFWVSDRGYSAGSSTVTISYYSDLKTPAAKDAFTAATNKLLGTIPAGASTIQKIILVHDYIALNTMYAYDDSGVLDPHHSAYHALVDNLATCTGFSAAYSYIMNRLGVETLLVEGEPYIDHSWNLVRVDGDWYHVDVLHAITRNGTVNRKIIGSVKHEEILLSDTTRLQYSQWYSLTPAATNATYETAFWQTVTTAFVNYNGKILYFPPATANSGDSNRLTVQNLTAWDVGTDEKTVLFSFAAKWMAPDGKYYTAKVPFIALYGDRLYYNTPTEIRYYDLTNMTDNGFIEEPTAPGSENTVQQIFEMAIKGDTLTYRIKERNTVSSDVIKEENVNLLTGAASAGSGYTNINANVDTVISISSGSPVALNVTPTAGGSITTASDVVTVSTNNVNGYNLSLSTSGADNALTGGAGSIAALVGTQASPISLAANSWGYRVDGVGGFGAGPTAAVSNAATEPHTWAGVPNNGASDTVKSTTGVASNDATTIWYGLKATSALASGNYTNTVVYTAATR